MPRPATDQDTIILGPCGTYGTFHRRGVFVNGSQVKLHYTKEATQDSVSLSTVLEQVIASLAKQIEEDTGITFPVQRVRALFDQNPA